MVVLNKVQKLNSSSNISYLTKVDSSETDYDFESQPDTTKNDNVTNKPDNDNNTSNDNFTETMHKISMQNK